MKTVFMFSGQGSQYYGMGRDLFASHGAFHNALRSLDTMFQDLGGPSVLRELYREDRTAASSFDALRFTHPAIFMIELALFQALLSEGVEPDCVLGASLGEYAAAAAAGVLDVEDIARCLIHQVDTVEALCPRGGMLAVLGDAQMFDREPVFRDNAELAAVNCARHFVVSGSPDGLSRVGEWLDAAKVLHQRLPVVYAFHSRWMDAAAEPYRRYLAALSMRRAKFGFISCETAGFVDAFEPAHFWRMVRAPIRFRDTIHALESAEEGWLYVDLGPTGTLVNFVKQIRAQGSRSECIAAISPFTQGTRGLQQVKEAYRQHASKHGSRSIKREEKMKAYLFPGQGSQSRGMGAELFEEFPELTERADRILGYSVAQLCRTDPDRQLDQTQFTQPALFTVNALAYLRETKGGVADGLAFVAGHSLGEYSALFAAGAFDFETGLALVQKRAALMAQVKDGGMAAVLGLDEAAVRKVLEDSGLHEIDVANYNGANQLILAGPRDSVQKAAPFFKEAGAQTYIPLRVSGAFHSRYMESARREFERFLSQFEFKPLKVPVIANVTGAPYEPGQVARMLSEQLTRPVRWDRTVQFLLRHGELELKEIGPGKVLTKLLVKIRAAAEAQPPAAPAPAAPPPKIRATAEAQPPAAPPPAAPARNGAAPVEPGGHAASANGAVRRATPPVEAVVTRPERTERTETPMKSGGERRFRPSSLGSAAFRETYGVKYAYVCGAMYRGIASEQLVLRAAHAGVLAFFGTGGLELARIEAAIRAIQGELRGGEPYGMNLVHNPTLPRQEDETVELFLKTGVRNVEAAAFMQVTPALVRFRLQGLRRDAHGAVEIRNRIIAKISRPEVAEAFLAPPSARILERLREEGKITADEARLGAEIPMADDLCVEADSGGHTDQRNPVVLVPTMLRLRDRFMEKHGYRTKVRVGAAGGIGTPEAAASAFVLGADFILTGSINQCTVEAGMSAVVKDMLEQINIQDTDYAPAGDMFELGAKVQVAKKGVFFAARAKKLYELYRQHESLDEIDAETRAQIEQRYFRRTFDDVYRETREYFMRKDPREIEKAEQNPKHKMALVFRWYFGHSQRIAMEGREASRVDFQVHCGPALGAFNQWVKGTPLMSWRNRHVDEIAEMLMRETAEYLNKRLAEMTL